MRANPHEWLSVYGIERYKLSHGYEFQRAQKNVMEVCLYNTFMFIEWQSQYEKLT